GGAEVMIGLVRRVIQDGILGGQPPGGHALEDGRGAASPDLLLADPIPEGQTEPPMEFEVAAVPPGRRDLEPPELFEAVPDLETGSRESADQARDIAASHQKIDIREHPRARIVVEIDEVRGAL